MGDSDLLADVQRAIQRAIETGDWVVLLCPDQITAASYKRSLACALPEGAPFSGRTARLVNGRISVAFISEKLFVPSGKSFVLTYAGWKSTDTSDGVTQWQSRASKVIVL